MSRPASTATKTKRTPKQQAAPRRAAATAAAATFAAMAGPAPVRPTTKPVGPVRRRGATSALEREADRTADAVLAGAVDLARGLGSAPPARRVVPASSGRPLSGAVRERLEQSLGADLSRVRIHDDAAAHRVVADEGASAFAAGPDIFFGAGEYQPWTDEGFHLLAHEVVHTLQQTGRAAAEGRRRVTDARGPGEVQAAGDAFAEHLAGMTGPTMFSTLTFDHGATSATSPLAAYVSKLAARLNRQIVPADQAYRDLVDDVLAGVDLPATAAELSFLLDVLKAGKAWEGAATLIETSLTPLATVRFSSDFAEWLVDQGHRGREWPVPAVEHKDGKALREYRDLSYGAFRIFLVRPDLKPFTVELSKADAMVDPPTWVTTALIPDDRVVIAAARLFEIEKQRFALCQRVDSRSGSTSVADDPREREFFGHAVFRGLRRAQWLAPELAAWSQQVVEPLAVRAGGWFEQKRALAEEFWATAQERWVREHEQRSGLVRGNLVTEDERARMRQVLDANPIAKDAARTVAKAGTEFLDAAHADLPLAAGYATRVAKLVKVLEAQTRNLLADMSAFRLDGATRARADLVPWLIFRLELLRQAARSYDQKADISTFPDTRHGHRLRMSGQLQWLAIEIGDSLLEQACLSVQHNRAGGESRLVLVSDWRHPETSDLDQLAEDFPGGVRFGPSIVFDSTAVAAFYKEAFLRRLGDEVERMLAPTAVVSAPDRLVLQESVKLAKQVRQARRWAVKEYDWAPHEDETRSIKDLVRSHPKSQEQLPKLSDDLTIAYPGEGVTASLGNLPHMPEVFAWELPAWDRLALQAALAMAELPELAALGPVGTEGMAWLRRAAEHVEKHKLAIEGKVRARIAARLDKQWQHQRSRLGVDKLPPGLLRQATNHDRAVVRRRAAAELAAYDGTFDTWERPVTALDLIEKFHEYALPTTDNLAQTAALVVELAASLKAAFVRESLGGRVVTEEDRYDLVTGYYGFVVIAQNWLRDPTKLATLTTSFTQLGADELKDRSADLVAVRTAFDTVRRRIQERRGFESVSRTGVRSLSYPFVVTTDEVFGGGDLPRYQLMRVLADFRFNPKYGEQGRKLEGDDDSQMGGYSKATVKDPKSNKDLPASTELFELRIGESTTIVRAADLDLLGTLWHAIEEKSFQLSMENLQAAMEATATLALDLAEFVPGAGQALAVGRIVVSIGAFVLSSDFDDIKEIVSGDLQKQIDHLVQHLKDMLNPDELWMLLLFDLDLGFLGRLAERSQAEDSGRARRARRHKGKLGRLLSALLGLGALIAREVELMHERVQPPLRNTQSFVVSHPVVATVVGLAADAMEYGLDAASPEVVKEFAGDPAKAMKARLEELVSAIDGFELPKDIIPEAMLIEAIIGLVLDRFGTKGKAIRKALEVTGAMAEISKLVRDRLPEAARPNTYWNEALRPEVDKVLATLRKDLIDGIYGALEQVGIKGVERPAHRPPQVVLTAGPVQEDDDEAAPALVPGRSPLALSSLPAYGGDVIPPGPGTPLPDRTRTAAEAGFGRSFDHVRLHRSPLVDGVDALTRGSHVVMRPGLSLDEGRGGHVLRHELTHVAQQTGDGPPRPTRGRPGATVRFDPRAEGAAERAAESGLLHRSPGHEGADAAAPAMSNKVLGQVLNRLADYQDLREFQEDIQGKVSTAPPLDAQQKTDVDTFRELLMKALEADALHVSGVPLKVGKLDPKSIVKDHAKNAALRLAGMDRPHPEALEHLFRQALREDRAAAKKKGSKAKAREFMVVPSQLSALLEGYLLVRTGLVTTIDLPRTSTAFTTALRAKVPLDLKVTGIFLGGATKASPLWKVILDNQFKPKKGRREEGALKNGKRNEFPLEDLADQEKLFQALIARIRARGPRFKALAPGYLLLPSLVEEAIDESLSPSGTSLPASDLPTPGKYVATTVGMLGKKEIGLRVDTHGRLGKLGAPDRESHHTTQYLFAEYFTNRVGNLKPFAGAREPGLTYTGKEPNVLFRADGGKAINLGGLAGTSGGRGEPMPAIYVSEHTHQRAGLHVGRKAALLPDGSTSSSSQSNTVDDWFRAKAPAAATAKELATPGSTPMAVKLFTPDQVKRNKELVAGVIHVYATMRKHMMRALDDALTGYERPYYESLAAQISDHVDTGSGRLKPNWQLRPADLNRVFATAKRKNDDVLALYGVKP